MAMAALRFPDVIDRLRAIDATPAGITGADVAARLQADRVEWAKIVVAANMRIE